MAVPKKKMSRSRSRRRKAGWKVPRPQLVACRQCNAPHLPHRMCLNCGTYNGREVVTADE